ncbi:hypothetical protein BGZ65_007028 [Modicella reniformis]|uniref:Myb/SANT-like domain-containing protein n=1 Tax=Modicella reniformis TaxID=1440133 RepID=A0A9P6M8D4_9FUNG|nr:hypothetical protein BGZ65_007028 [Modicella reniformis]
MDTFVDWLTDPRNHDLLHKKRIHLGGEKPRKAYAEIAEIIQTKHGVRWSTDTVYSKLAYSKKKYEQARALEAKAKKVAATATAAEMEDTELIRNRILFICPPYDKFYRIWGDGLGSRSPPRLRQTIMSADDQVSVKESSSDVSDVEHELLGAGGDQTHELEAESVVSDRENTEEPLKRRRKHNDTRTLEELTRLLGHFQTAAEREAEIQAMHLKEFGDRRNDLRHREQVLERRDSDQAERLLETEKKHQEMLDRRVQNTDANLVERTRAFEAEKDALAKRILELREELKQERQEIKQERQELRQEWQEFRQERLELKERDRLLQENTVMKKEIEIRNRLHGT